MQEWLKGFEQGATNMIRTLWVEKREQVREYYLPLWLWHRLNAKRWECSQVTLRDNQGKLRLEVDHIGSFKLLEDRISRANGEEIQSLGNRDDFLALSNSIGNCFLMEKTFNVSKGKQSLNDFLDKVRQFSQSNLDPNSWGDALSIDEALLWSDVAKLPDLADAIKRREGVLKEDLITFVAGSVARVDLK
jgi:hypothetical protein